MDTAVKNNDFIIIYSDTYKRKLVGKVTDDKVGILILIQIGWKDVSTNDPFSPGPSRM